MNNTTKNPENQDLLDVVNATNVAQFVWDVVDFDDPPEVIGEKLVNAAKLNIKEWMSEYEPMKAYGMICFNAVRLGLFDSPAEYDMFQAAITEALLNPEN